jgi:hypothetical protein
MFGVRDVNAPKSRELVKRAGTTASAAPIGEAAAAASVVLLAIHKTIQPRAKIRCTANLIGGDLAKTLATPTDFSHYLQEMTANR